MTLKLVVSIVLITLPNLTLSASWAFTDHPRCEVSLKPIEQTATSTWDSGVIGSGEVRPNRYVQIRSAVPGRVEKIYVEPGDDVSKGQALFLIASESTSRARVTRYSPLTGVVADIPVRTGESTAGDTPLMTIADMSRISVDVFLDRPNFAKVIVNQPAMIRIDAFHEARIIGRVVSKNPKPITVSDAPDDAPEFRVRVQMTQVSNYIRRRIRPGMSATASIQVAPPKSSCKRQPIEDLVAAFAESFSNKSMGTLDTGRPYVGRFTIRIEHSLADDDDPQRFEVRRFSSFARAERWFKRREIEDLPGRYTRPVEKCVRGVCTYNLDGGINHRSLYLQEITYGVRNGCPYIKTIYILDGD
ncbi:MAG: HlyD family efflux transporter periplasmic adaptor subunit [Pyrinomonadaceae bacterium]